MNVRYVRNICLIQKIYYLEWMWRFLLFALVDIDRKVLIEFEWRDDEAFNKHVIIYSLYTWRADS